MSSNEQRPSPVEGAVRLRAVPELTEEDDARLADAVAAGEEAALAELYARHGREVFAVARGMVGHVPAAGDVVAEVFVELWESPEGFDPRLGPLRSHLLLLARRSSLEQLRSEGPVQGTLDVELDRLADDRRILELAFLDGYSCLELALMVDATEDEMKQRLGIGLRRLRRFAVD